MRYHLDTDSLFYVADGRIVLDELVAGGSDDGGAAAPATAPSTPWRRALPWAAGALGLAVGIGSLAVRGARSGAEPRDLPVLRFAIPFSGRCPCLVATS